MHKILIIVRATFNNEDIYFFFFPHFSTMHLQSPVSLLTSMRRVDVVGISLSLDDMSIDAYGEGEGNR